MSRLIEIPLNSKFGKWTVLSKAGRKGHSFFWNCVCECGKEQKVNGYSLRTHTSSQCRSCVLKLIKPAAYAAMKQSALEYSGNGKAALRSLLYRYKKSAKDRDLLFNLTDKQFKELTSKNCHYCNKSPKNVSGPKSMDYKEYGVYVYNGIDRKNNLIGYEIENCVSCCETCNKAKLEMSYEEFKIWIRQVYNYFGEQ